MRLEWTWYEASDILQTEDFISKFCSDYENNISNE
jgi:hypothetical protein